MRKLPLSLTMCLMALLALMSAPSSAVAQHFDDTIVYSTTIGKTLPRCAPFEALTFDGASFKCVNRDDLPVCPPGLILTSQPKPPPAIGGEFVCVPLVPTCPLGQLLTTTGVPPTFTCAVPAPTCAPGEFLTGTAAGFVCQTIASIMNCLPGEALTVHDLPPPTLLCEPLPAIPPPPPPPSPVCGDSICNGSETCVSCAGDCGACPPSPTCGDGVCSGSDSCANCAGDCGACPPPPPSGSPPSGCPSPPTASSGCWIPSTWGPYGWSNPESTPCPGALGCPAGQTYSSMCGASWVNTSCTANPGSTCRSTNFTCDGAIHENCYSYGAEQCGGPPPPPPSGFCGDGSCNNGENCSSCSGDCGACAPPPCDPWACDPACSRNCGGGCCVPTGGNCGWCMM